MSEQQTQLKLRDGDVFLFSYSEAARARANGRDLHWCFDGQLVASNGQLSDTYWGFNDSNARVVRPEDGLLKFVCNLNDVTDIRESECRYYADEDIFNLTSHHGYRKRFAVPTGTQRSQAKMLAQIDDKIRELRDRAERTVRMAMFDTERLAADRVKVEAGNTEVTLVW